MTLDRIREEDIQNKGPGYYEPNQNFVMKRSPALSLGKKQKQQTKSIKNYMETFIHKILSPS